MGLGVGGEKFLESLEVGDQSGVGSKKIAADELLLAVDRSQAGVDGEGAG